MLLNNAAVAVTGHSFEGLDNWKSVLDVNLFGCAFSFLSAPAFVDVASHSVLNVQHTFVPVRPHNLSCGVTPNCTEMETQLLVDASPGEPVGNYQHRIQTGHHEPPVSIGITPGLVLR